jgi:hypothetical protein
MEVRFRQARAPRGQSWRLLPNINVSGRPLPAEVSADDLARNAQTDREKPTRKLKDREIHAFLVVLSAEEWARATQPLLEVHFGDGLFAVLNQSGTPLPAATKSPVRIPLRRACRSRSCRWR